MCQGSPSGLTYPWSTPFFLNALSFPVISSQLDAPSLSLLVCEMELVPFYRATGGFCELMQFQAEQRHRLVKKFCKDKNPFY